jgi:NAD(P)-dependent dehydrogenase (short-subunit alcohol dehydrogenase family)
MKSKTILVTGANRGIGFGAARELARRGHRVLMACRDPIRAAIARDALAEDKAVRAAGGSLELERLDLGSLESIRELSFSLAARGERLDALLNNAGIFRPEREETEEGFEACLGVNFLGPFLLTRLLLPLLAPEGRIVNTTSVAALFGKFDLDALDLKKGYGPFKAYARSKLAIIFISLEFAERFRGRATVNAVHPGIVNTSILTMRRWYDPLADAIFRPFVFDIDEGARPCVELAVSPKLEGLTGLYFSRLKPRRLPDRISLSPLRAELWELASALVGLDP